MYLNKKFRSAAKEFEKKCKIAGLSMDYTYPSSLSAEVFEERMKKSIWEFFNFLVEEVKENGRDAIQYHEEPLREEYQKMVVASDGLIALNPVLRSVNLRRVNSQTDDVFDVANALGDEHDFQSGVISSYLPCDIDYCLNDYSHFSDDEKTALGKKMDDVARKINPLCMVPEWIVSPSTLQSLESKAEEVTARENRTFHGRSVRCVKSIIGHLVVKAFGDPHYV